MFGLMGKDFGDWFRPYPRPSLTSESLSVVGNQMTMWQVVRRTLWIVPVGLCLAVAASGGEGSREQPEAVLLWPEGAPGAVGEEEADRPSIRIYRAEEPNGAAIVVCPGGGYGHLAIDHEGHQIAQWLNSIGVTAAVLQYRHAPRYQHPVPLNDVQRAIRCVRNRADELGVARTRVGVMGFSAGGHLASTVSTHFDEGDATAADPIERESCRPSFTVLGYPVISFRESFGHAGSRRNLLGENPEPALVDSLSNETQVNEKTPPAFLFHTAEDTVVPVENSLAYFRALQKHGVPAELHVYQNGPHGVGLGIADPVLFTWKDRLADWLQTNGLLSNVERAAISGQVSLNGKPLQSGTITFEPLDASRAPIAAGHIRGGKYSIPASRGIAIGHNRVTVRSLSGGVPGRRGLNDVITITGNGTLAGEVTYEAKSGQNSFDLDIETLSLPDAKVVPGGTKPE